MLRKQESKADHDAAGVGVFHIAIATQTPQIFGAGKRVGCRLPDEIDRQILKLVDTSWGL